MKIKVFGLVLILHVAVLGLLLQPGCKTVSDNSTAMNDSALGNEEYSGLWETQNIRSSHQDKKQLRAASKPSIKKDTVKRTVAYKEEITPEYVDLRQPVVETASVYREGNEHFEYTVANGDSLWKIASSNKVSMRKLMSYNGLKENDYIRPGQVLLIPGVASPVVASSEPVDVEPKEFPTTVVADNSVSAPVIEEKVEGAPVSNIAAFNEVELATVTIPATPQLEEATEDVGIYEVQAGDSLYIIAMQNNTTVEKIRRYNNLTKNLIKVGQKIRIPGKYIGDLDIPVEQKSVSVVEKSRSPLSGEFLEHEVKPGEFPGLIAAKYNMNVADLLQINEVRNPRTLKVGAKLKVINPEFMLQKTQVADKTERADNEAVAVRVDEKTESEADDAEKSVSGIDFNDYPVVRVGS